MFEELHEAETATDFVRSLKEAIGEIGIPGSLEIDESNEVGRFLEELYNLVADRESTFG